MHRRVVWPASCVRHSLTARASLARVTNLSYHKTRYWNRKFTGRRVYKNSATTRVIKARVRDRPSTDLQARFREGTTPISAVADAAIVALDLPWRRTRWGDAVTRITSGAAAVDAGRHVPSAARLAGRAPARRHGWLRPRPPLGRGSACRSSICPAMPLSSTARRPRPGVHLG
jgi:hypothetical protein